MKFDRFSRREFLAMGAGAAGASLVTKNILLDPEPAWAFQGPVSPSDRVRFGMIGVGMQGSGLLASSIELPGVECVAAADLYDGRHTLA
ncbi:MAG: gfo/Idh/MocA family oxidoreductase, partial [Acidobacteria bacterium]